MGPLVRKQSRLNRTVLIYHGFLFSNIQSKVLLFLPTPITLSFMLHTSSHLKLCIRAVRSKKAKGMLVKYKNQLYKTIKNKY